MAILSVNDTAHPPQDTWLSDLQARLSRLQAEAERNSRSGTLDYDERTRWRRFAAQLQEALRG